MSNMQKPDVLITWPSGCDYPLCRLQLSTFRKYFRDIIVTFYDHGTPDFRDFIKGAHKDWRFLYSPIINEQWREAAVTVGLGESASPEVLFTEQDFFWKDDSFLSIVEKAREKFDIVGIKQGNRLHPCFLRTSRELIEATEKDFSVRGQDQDHFQKFSEQALALGSCIDLRDLGLFEGRDWYHFSSLTWNLFRIKDDNIREMHDLPEFLLYNAYSRTKKVKQDPRWLAMTYYTETLLTKYGKFLNL